MVINLKLLKKLQNCLSLPVNSYYQFVGYGTKFIKYDDKPKEYIQENINESLKLIKNLKAELGGNNIYDALFDVGYATYENLNFRKNIFLLTGGKIEDRKKVFDFIKNNNSLFRIFLIGIGDNIDEGLIKRIGSIGRGSYDFCKKYEDINSIIDKNVNNVINPWIYGLKIKCSLDNDNIYEQGLPKKIRQNDLINLKYKIAKNGNDKVDLRVIYKADNNEKIDKKYEIIPKEIPEGEDLSKLIIKDLVDNMEEEDEKKEISLKYQIFNNYTSLFAEVELSDKITEEMKLKIIGNKKKNILEIFNMGMGGMDLNFGMNNINNMNMGMNNMNMMGMGMNNMSMMNMGMNNMSMMNMGMNNMNMMNMGMNNMNMMNMGMNFRYMRVNPMTGMDDMDLLYPMIQTTLTSEEKKKL